MKKTILILVILITSFSYSQKIIVGNTNIGCGAKGDKGDMPTFSINSVLVEDGDNILIEGGSGLANTFTASSKADLENVANAGKVAIIESTINLGSQTVNLQKGMTLQFSGGGFENGTINWNSNLISANPLTSLFSNTNVGHTGVGYPQDIFVEWFGAVADGTNFINAIAGNVIVGTLGISYTDRAIEFMKICKGGTLVFSDTSAEYLVNLGNPEDGVDSSKRNFGINYTASGTNIRIDKGVVLRGGGVVTADYTSVIAIFRADNITIYGGGHIKGNKYTESIPDTVGENGIGITFASKCENLVVDGVILSEMAGDGFAFSNDHNYIDENNDKPSITPSSYTNGTLNNDGTVTPDSSKNQIYSDLMVLSADALLYDYTILLAYYNGYEGTEGLFDVAFYNVSDELIELRRRQYMYEYLYFPVGVAKMRISFYRKDDTYPKNNDYQIISDGSDYIDVYKDSGSEETMRRYDQAYLSTWNDPAYGEIIKLDGVDLVRGVDYELSDNAVDSIPAVVPYDEFSIRTTGTRIRFTVAPTAGQTIYVGGRIQHPLEMNMRPDTYVNNVTIKNCEIFDVNRNGISVTVAQNVLIDNCYIHDIEGLESLTSGIDVEDGFMLNRYITIQGCTFKNCGKYDVVTLNSQDMVIKDCTMLPITGGEETLVRITTSGEGSKITNCTVYGGSITLSDKAIMTDCKLHHIQLDVASGIVENTLFFNSYVSIKAEDYCRFSNLTFRNSYNKTAYEQNPFLASILSGQIITVENVEVQPELLFENILIDGDDLLGAFSGGNKNTIIKGLKVTNSSVGLGITAKYAENIENINGSIGITATDGSSTTIKNIKAKELVFHGSFDNPVIIDGAEITNDIVFGSPLVDLVNRNFSDLTIQNSIFTATNAHPSNSDFITGSGNISGFRFINNKINGQNSGTEIFELTGTNTGTWLFKNNEIINMNFNTEVGSIKYNNIVDGVLVP